MKTISFIILSVFFLSLSVHETKTEETNSAYILPETAVSTMSAEDQANKPNLLYFGAEWCPPCKITRQNLNSPKVKKELERFNVKFFDIDVDLVEKKQYGIKMVPTIIISDKEMRHRYVGGKSIQELLDILRKH